MGGTGLWGAGTYSREAGCLERGRGGKEAGRRQERGSGSWGGKQALRRASNWCPGTQHQHLEGLVLSTPRTQYSQGLSTSTSEDLVLSTPVDSLPSTSRVWYSVLPELSTPRDSVPAPPRTDWAAPAPRDARSGWGSGGHSSGPGPQLSSGARRALLGAGAAGRAGPRHEGGPVREPGPRWAREGSGQGARA